MDLVGGQQHALIGAAVGGAQQQQQQQQQQLLAPLPNNHYRHDSAALQQGDRTTWEYHTVAVTRVPGYGFGIAVSGGRDNPHFANGDPSIAVSDVLKGGPAEDRLQVNDRIISVNGVSLENVEYATAVQVLRDSGNTVTLVVKRRVPLNTHANMVGGSGGGMMNSLPQQQQQQQHQHSLSMNSMGAMTTSASAAAAGMNGNGGGMMSHHPSGMIPLVGLSQPNSLNSSLVQSNQSAGSAGLTTTMGGGQPIKVTLSKGGKKDDYGVVLGCRLFIKEISSKARDQLAANGYSLQEGDVITRIHNTNCGDTMSLKEAKKIIDGCKERLNLVVLRDITNQAALASAAANAGNQLNNSTVGQQQQQQQQQQIYSGHQAQLSNCSNNLDDPYLNGGLVGPGGVAGGVVGGVNYSSQNLYVQPPTRSSATSNGNGHTNGGLSDEKSNLTPRGRSRGPIMDGGMSLTQQLDRPVSPSGGRSRTGLIDDPPRPPPPRGSSAGGGGDGNENYYSSRRQLYEEEAIARSRQSSEPRFISFQKEGSVGIRLTGGNEAGIFVTAVQPGSPASLQGLTPGDKILKVNDMDMHGVTREEAVLFLLSLQDRIDLIVQYCKDEYDEVVQNQRGDSFHIKTHFHCDNPSKGEMAFKAGDVFRVIDTLHNGVVGSWQVLKIGRGHQEMQRGVIPNKARAEELATAQFNATKKEMNSNESRGNFFRRRRSTHRRSKSLNRENWDDVVFSDSISKFPAYERVVLRHPGFVRPVVLFGPISDLARDKLAKDYPDKFTAPLQDDDKTNGKCRIVRLSNIRDLMDRGKHALLDITPNAVDRLNYAQFYPIVLFLKTDSKHVIKQLRAGMPKSAHKSSKKLLEQCQKLERVWSHIFSTQIVLSDEEAWYRRLRDGIDLQQSGAVWMSETKPVESLSDDFLFPMATSRLSYASSPESDLELSPGPSASLSLGNLPQLVKSSSDPSIATNQDNLDRDRDIIGDGLPPPYTIPYEHSMNTPSSRRQTMDSNKYVAYTTAGASSNSMMTSGGTTTDPSTTPSTRPQSLYGINAPDLPPRIDRQSKPGDMPMTAAPRATNNSAGGTLGRSAQERLFGNGGVGGGKPTMLNDPDAMVVSGGGGAGGDPAAVEYMTTRALNHPSEALDRQQLSAASLERQARLNAAATSMAGKTPGGGAPQQNGGSSYDSVSSYDSYNAAQLTMQNLGRLGPNAPDDLKSVPNVNGRPLPPVGLNSQGAEYARSAHDHRPYVGGANDLNRQSSPGRPQYHEVNAMRNIDPRNGQPQRPSNLGLEGSPRKPVVETKTDYGKYSRNNSATQADYNKLPKNAHMVLPPHQNMNGNGGGVITPNGGTAGGPPGGPFKPVPPPKPKNYRPPMQGGSGGGGAPGWENGDGDSPRSPNGFFYPPTPSHHHYSQQNTPGSPHQGGAHQSSNYSGSNGNYAQAPQYGATPNNGYNNGVNGSHHYNGGSGTGPYIAPHRGMPPPIGNLPPHTPERHALDLAGSREQRGSAFELYRKPQIGAAGHHHNMSEMEPIYDQRYEDYYAMPPPGPPPLPHPHPHAHSRARSAPRGGYPNDNGSGPEGHYYDYYDQLPPPQRRGPPPPPHHYYDESVGPPPEPPQLPPIKPKKKSVLKSPLTAIKNALIKTARPLRRMNSMVEPADKRPKSALKRQHSLLERGMQRPYYPDEYPTYPAGFEASQGYRGRRAMTPDEQYYHQQQQQQHHHQYQQQHQQQQYYEDNRRRRYHHQRPSDDLLNSTYQNLEAEDIYGNIGGTAPRAATGPLLPPGNGYADEQVDDLYANRASIDLERRQAESAAGRHGRRIVRRHSTTTADQRGGGPPPSMGGAHNRRAFMTATGGGGMTGYEGPHSAYAHDRMLDPRRAPNSEVMARRRFYPGAANELLNDVGDGGSGGPEGLYPTRRELQRELQRSHLQQSRREMQERITQGKRDIEREFSPPPSTSSQSERDDKSDRDSGIYQTSRRDLMGACGGPGLGPGPGGPAVGALKTRAQLREQIYQTRREALDSMAEPVYVTKRDLISGRPEPIYETREESILQSRENETDERKEGKPVAATSAGRPNSHEITIVEINRSTQAQAEAAAAAEEQETLSRSDLQKSTDTVIENPANKDDQVAIEAMDKKAPLVRGEEEDDDEEEDFSATKEGTVLAASTALNEGMLQDTNAALEMEDDVFVAPPLAISSPLPAPTPHTTSPLVVAGPPIVPLEPPRPTATITSPRSTRPPFHISNLLKRTPPPTVPPTDTEMPPSAVPPQPSPEAAVVAPLQEKTDSRASIATQYMSQASLPVGPPNATSTPYPSNMSLPIAGPTPTSAPAAASQPGVGQFPVMPREPTTSRAIFDCTGGTLTDAEWNVSLQIPPGAIAPGVQQEVYFTVSDPRMGEAVGGPPLDMENGETMLSPLVMCGPQGLEFRVPVTLNIPHCAGRTMSLGLALKATDSEKQLHTEWDNIDLPSNAAAHTVSVKVDHF